MNTKEFENQLNDLIEGQTDKPSEPPVEPTDADTPPVPSGGWTMGRRLVAGATVIALFITVIAGVGFVFTSNIADSFDLLVEDSLVEREALADIDANSLAFLNHVRSYVLFGTETDLVRIDEAQADLNEALATYTAIEQEFHYTEDIDPARRFANRFRDLVNMLQEEGAILVNLYNNGAEAEDLVAAGRDLVRVETVLENLLDEAEQTLDEEIENTANTVRTAVIRARTFLLIFSLSALVVTFGVSYLLQRLVARRLGQVAETARHITAGHLMEVAEVDSSDEIGEVVVAFNTMTARLRGMIDDLEGRVDERTQQLETILELSQRLTGILDLSDLLREVVTLTKEKFGYYHTHIYLLESNVLVIAEGYGLAGAELKRQGHTISLDASRSLVARSAREGRIIVVQDVRNDPTWLPNPLLPNTSSEIAIPIKSGSEVLGVFDVQSDRVEIWTHEDEAMLESLANQIATAIRNAQAFSETRTALYEAQRLQKLYTREGWEQLTQSQTTTDYESRHPSVPPLDKVATPEATAALQQKQLIHLRWPRASDASSDGENVAITQHNALATPLMLRGQVIGVLGIHDDDLDRRWTEDEMALMEAVSEQMSLALENARLFDETGRRANRERIIADMTQQVWASGDLEKVMQTAVEQLGVVLDASKVVIKLGTEEQLSQPSQAAE